jgi:hypothetical protein
MMLSCAGVASRLSISHVIMAVCAMFAGNDVVISEFRKYVPPGRVQVCGSVGHSGCAEWMVGDGLLQTCGAH